MAPGTVFILRAASTADTYHMHRMHMQGRKRDAWWGPRGAAPLLAGEPGTRVSIDVPSIDALLSPKGLRGHHWPAPKHSGERKKELAHPGALSKFRLAGFSGTVSPASKSEPRSC